MSSTNTSTGCRNKHAIIDHKVLCQCGDDVHIQLSQRCPLCGGWLLANEKITSDSMDFMYHTECVEYLLTPIG